VANPLTCSKQAILGIVGLSVCTAATGYGEYASGATAGWLVVDVVVGVLACVLIPLAFRRPVTGALAAAVLAAVAATATPVSTFATMWTARNRSFPLAVGVGLVGAVAHAVRWLWSPMIGLSFVWWLALVFVGHAALVGIGALAQARHALLSSLEERALRAEAEQGRRVAEARAAERAAIAREMHDVLAHRLSLLATYAGALEYRPDLPPDRLSDAAGVIRASTHQALEELRDVIALLRDEDDGLARPVPALADLPELIDEARGAGSPVTVDDEAADLAALPGQTGRTAYRVLQEALTNARKHAPGQPVRVALEGAPGARLVIEVVNPVSTSSGIPGGGSGLVGLTERVRLAGGQLDHHRTASEFRLRTWLPWPA
jgi:signal transduction histidine kinase